MSNTQHYSIHLLLPTDESWEGFCESVEGGMETLDPGRDQNVRQLNILNPVSLCQLIACVRKVEWKGGGMVIKPK